jgi:hypothetical protein
LQWTETNVNEFFLWLTYDDALKILSCIVPLSHWAGWLPDVWGDGLDLIIWAFDIGVKPEEGFAVLCFSCSVRTLNLTLS